MTAQHFDPKHIHSIEITSGCTLYSALGIGFPFVSMKPAVTPYVTPIGFRAGGKHFYGLIELNLSSASTLGHAGIGYRF